MAADLGIARKVVGLSRRQNGAIRVDQLLSAGVTRSAIRARLARGRLVLLFPGVYGIGDPELVPLMRPTAAVLSIGPAAVLSHRSAATVWGFAEADPDVIDVTAIGKRPRPRAGVRLHCAKALENTTTHCNVPITTPARTLIDLAHRRAHRS
jgi:predicted transcriptional regulator of viral defense system